MSSKKKIKVGKFILYVVLSFGAIVMVLPFIWTVLSSLKNMGQTFAYPVKIFPDPVVWENYPESLSALPFGRAYWNSFYIAAYCCDFSVVNGNDGGIFFRKVEI